MAQPTHHPPPKQGVEAVERALSLLVAFRDGDGPLTLTELAARTGLHKSTALRLFASLLRHSFLRRLPDGRYHLGPELLRLAQLYQQSFHLTEVVVPALRRLSEVTGETAAFYIRDGDSRICLHRVEPARTVRATASVGARFPLDRGASGKVLLAFENSPAARFAEIRRAMWAVSLGERNPETAAIACPVFGVMGALCGSLSIAGPRERMTATAFSRIRPQLLAAAADLTDTLGGDSSQLRAQLRGAQRTPRASGKPVRPTSTR
jgi:DNA-binding IclR family transcriptional regulator